MRRTVKFAAGLLLAAGASIALSSPASAAPAPSGPPSVPSNPASSYQYHGLSTNWTNQTTLNNFGNPQVGLFNYNGGGVAVSSNATGQYGGLFGGLGGF